MHILVLCGARSVCAFFCRSKERDRMREFKKYRPLLYELVIRDVKIKYRRSLLGVLWTVLNPLLMMAVLYLVFSNLFRFDIENYAIYVMCGQVIFNYYQNSTTDAMLSVLGNAMLIKKVYLPKYLLVLAKILSGAVNLAASFAALLVVLLATGEKLRMELWWTAIPFAGVMTFSFGAGLLLAAVTVRFRDIQHLYGIFCTALFYLTTVIYPFSILPDFMKDIVYFNPLTRMVETFRDIVMEGKPPGPVDLWFCIVPAMCILTVGAFVFKRAEKTFILNL